MFCKCKQLHLCIKIGIIAAAIAIGLIILAFFVHPWPMSVGLAAIGVFLLVLSLLLICKNKLISAINTVGLMMVGISILLAVLALLFVCGYLPIILISAAALALCIPGIILTFKRCKKNDRHCSRKQRPNTERSG